MRVAYQPAAMVRLATIIGLLVLTSQASGAPATAPSNAISEIELQDPSQPNSKCYLDLDNGRTFTFGDSKPQDLNASRVWMREKSVDLMCESRPPVGGFVAYHMALAATDSVIDSIDRYATLAAQLRAVETEVFQTVVVKQTGSKTYLFRTQEGSIGMFEASAAADSEGIRIRYRILPQPTPTQPVPNRRIARLPVGVGLAPGAPPVVFSLRDALAPLVFDFKPPSAADDSLPNLPHNGADRFTLERVPDKSVDDRSPRALR